MRRRDFLKSCCDNFVAHMRVCHEIAYYDPALPDDITDAYYDSLLPEIRMELAGGHDNELEPHPVDRHKIAAATAFLILASQPMRSARQLQASGTYAGEPPSSLNSLFAVYTAVAAIDQWRVLTGQTKLRISKNAKRFIREHVKLMTKCHGYPIFAAAQSFYLLEELCLATENICHAPDCPARASARTSPDAVTRPRRGV